MFNLGKKEAIINSSSKYAPTVSSSLLTLKGFGAFEGAHVTSAIAQRFKPSRVEKLTFTAPTAAALGVVTGEINVPVVVHIRVNTTRYTSEWANDFIKRGRPFIFEILLNAGEDAAAVMTKLVAAFAAYNERFPLAERGLPFTYAQDTSSVTLTLKDPYLYFQTNVEFLPRGLTYGVKAVSTKYMANGTVGIATGTTITLLTGDTTALKVGDSVLLPITGPATSERLVTDIVSNTVFTVNSTITTVAGNVTLMTTAFEPVWNGKYLEENVRMSVPATSHSYGISPDETPVIAGSYTSIQFTAKVTAEAGLDDKHNPHLFLGNTRGEQAGDKYFTFTLYYLEGGSDLWTDSAGYPVYDVLTWLTTQCPSATIKLYLANGNEVSTVADFFTNTY